MKALVVCPYFPYPLDGGSKLAVHSHLCGLRAMGYCDIDIVCFQPPQQVLPSAVFRDILFLRKPPKLRTKQLTRALVGRSSYLFARYYSEENRQLLDDFLARRDYDIAVIEHTYMAQYFDPKTRRCADLMILGSGVLEGRALLSRAQLSSNPLVRWVLTEEGHRTGKRECELLRAFDGSFFYGKEDLEWYRIRSGADNACLSPLGLDFTRYKIAPRRRSRHSRIVLYGSFSWFPNRDGLRYLLGDVWPLVRRSLADVTLVIAGTGIPDWAHEYPDASVEVVGKVESLGELVGDCDVVLAPIRVGGGTRVKILEAMAWGRPVLASSAAIEGIGVKPGRGVMVADTPEEFCRELSLLLDDSDRWRECVELASDYIHHHHDAQLVLRKVLASCLGRAEAASLRSLERSFLT